MNLLRPIYYLIISSIFFLSCAKDEVLFDPIAQFDLEQPQIKTYANTNYPNMIYSGDTTGIWYEIVNPGTPDSYEYKVVDTINYYGQAVKTLRMPTITVKYVGKLITDNSIFDSNQTEAGFISNLGGLISAWQIAFVPKSVGAISFGGLTTKGLQKGSKIRIVTPSYYAYGNRAAGKIPANSPLFFEIEVINIK
ncbi:FKBP-type peptidyl-prolyl cis-trans isomerase [Sphingobacterium bovistauri]|uniref:Peptidyl-prolyl cis-trans isomerase n=1 Tax=Sphingobacterium bovistauri TaxID=2781959 RepID=A0ABS7Z126_9SPHI|nr:FKBP-type peptidyl-prolyl cis-trans isomerase [Sphingobacterium bovistauri]MCA5003876.1 FKBP-type peptidyl-prolyl cis-trans isomerase [Sphingobacterium bovistauri]